MWNCEPDDRAGQSEECLTTVTACITANRQFFQFEIGKNQADLGKTKQNTLC